MQSNDPDITVSAQVSSNMLIMDTQNEGNGAYGSGNSLMLLWLIVPFLLGIPNLFVMLILMVGMIGSLQLWTMIAILATPYPWSAAGTLYLLWCIIHRRYNFGFRKHKGTQVTRYDVGIKRIVLCLITFLNLILFEITIRLVVQGDEFGQRGSLGVLTSCVVSTLASFVLSALIMLWAPITKLGSSSFDAE